MKEKKPEYSKFFTNVPLTLAQFGPAFRQAYDSNPNGFTQVQHDYIAYSHYIPQVQAIKKNTGFNVLESSRAIQEMIWSFSVQHRNNTPTAFNAAVGKNWESMTNVEIITAMYDYRYAKWSCCRPRFLAEKKDILALENSGS